MNKKQILDNLYNTEMEMYGVPAIYAYITHKRGFTLARIRDYLMDISTKLGFIAQEIDNQLYKFPAPKTPEGLKEMIKDQKEQAKKDEKRIIKSILTSQPIIPKEGETK